jgi:Pyridoxamine 5'-phosphate oxidase
MFPVPLEVEAVFHEFRTCELSTVAKNGTPLTWPTTALYEPEHDRFLITTSIGLPQKAFNIRRNPRVALLFSNPTGSGLSHPPAVLVQGDARVSEYRLPQIRSKLAFELLNRVGPLQRLSRLVVVANKVLDGLLKLIEAGKMLGLQKFALQQAEPNFDLIKPGGIGRQPIELHREFAIRPRSQFLDPEGELLGCMG